MGPRSCWDPSEIAIRDLPEPLEKTTLRPIAESLVSVATCDRSVPGWCRSLVQPFQTIRTHIATDRICDRSHRDTTGRNQSVLWYRNHAVRSVSLARDRSQGMKSVPKAVWWKPNSLNEIGRKQREIGRKSWDRSQLTWIGLTLGTHWDRLHLSGVGRNYMGSVPRSVPEPGIGNRALGSVPDHKNEENDVLKAKTKPFCHRTLPRSILYEKKYFYESCFKRRKTHIGF